MTTIASQSKTAPSAKMIGRYTCRHATRADDAAIRGLLRQPMPGRVQIATPHEPSHQAAMRLIGDRHHDVVIQEQTQNGTHAVGCAYRSVRKLSINGQMQQAGYLGGLRCEAKLRAAFRVLGLSFDTLAQTRRDDELPYDFTSIMADNDVVRRGLEKGLPGLPRYTPIGEMVTLTLRTSAKHQRITQARQAIPSDRAAIDHCLRQGIQRAHGRPAYLKASIPPQAEDFFITGQPDEPGGCLALWDQRAQRQVLVADLSTGLRRARRWINLVSACRGTPRLPRPGTTLSMAYASHACFDLDDSDTAIALIALASATAAARGIKLLSIGLPASAPLIDELRRRFKPWCSTSVIYAVTHDPQHIDLDDRPVWMEVATL